MDILLTRDMVWRIVRETLDQVDGKLSFVEGVTYRDWMHRNERFARKAEEAFADKTWRLMIFEAAKQGTIEKYEGVLDIIRLGSFSDAAKELEQANTLCEEYTIRMSGVDDTFSRTFSKGCAVCPLFKSLGKPCYEEEHFCSVIEALDRDDMDAAIAQLEAFISVIRDTKLS